MATVENEIETIYELEHSIASRKQKLRQHAQKWSCLKEIIIDNTDEYLDQYNDTM